ncbi:MAG: family 10 glycosylhydrolase [Abditibacteriota bacterium]|nr:family 10 glycosylhydrolase [Abditibacteriota bacterium]
MKRLMALIFLIIFLFAAAGDCAGEMRGFWLDFFGNGFYKKPDSSWKTILDSVVSQTSNAKMNVIIVHIRNCGISFYPSEIELNSSRMPLTFDPLEYLIQKAHSAQKPIKVYAWFSVYPAWYDETANPGSGHIYKLHPEWLSPDTYGDLWDGSAYYWLDPGVPAVSDYTVSLINEAVTKYDLDGINLDFVRLDWNTRGYNPTSLSRYHALNGTYDKPAYTNAAWADFRRRQITEFVRRAYMTVHAAKPDCVVTAATISNSADTSWTASNAYYRLMQDWVAWAEEGIIDANIQMTYYSDGTESAKFDSSLEFLAANKGLAGAVPTVYGPKNTLSQVFQQLSRVKNNGNFDGATIFSYFNPCSNSTVSSLLQHLRTLYKTVVQPFTPPNTTGHIYGRVTEFGIGVDGATVYCDEVPCITDGCGYYGFAHLAPGSHSLRVAAPGCAVRSGSASVTAGRVTTKNYELGSVDNTPTITKVVLTTMGDGRKKLTWNTGRACRYNITVDGVSYSDPNYVASHILVFSGTASRYTITCTTRGGASSTYTYPAAPSVLLRDVLLMVGQRVTLTEKLIVSAVFADGIYAQCADGSRGVKITNITGARVGDEVTVSGMVRVVNGEYVIGN